jgi:hypothetical protein
MRAAVELSDVQYVALVLKDCGLVVIYVQVVRRAEDRHHRWEACGASFTVHAVAYECKV